MYNEKDSTEILKLWKSVMASSLCFENVPTNWKLIPTPLTVLSQIKFLKFKDKN